MINYSRLDSNSFVFRFIKPFIDQILLSRWIVQGKPAPPPHIVKTRTILSYARKNKIDILIETGTYLGDTVFATKDSFKNIYTIELDKCLYQKATIRFSNNYNVKVLNGDSGEVLSVLLKKINRPCIFWLDAHYSGGVTAKGKKETPIERELEVILKHKMKKHVILIDDARLFVGKGDYPTLSIIKLLINKIQPSKKVDVENDLIRVY